MLKRLLTESLLSEMWSRDMCMKSPSAGNTEMHSMGL